MYLITPSLLNSWLWYLASEKSEERDKFILTLKRIYGEPNRPILFGKKFEEDVEAICNSRPLEEEEESYVRHTKQVAGIVDGGTWQLPCKKKYKDYLLYGRMDVVKGNIIIDIKTTSNYNVGKFKSSAQHKLYLYCTGLTYCDYVVVEVYHGEKDTVCKGLSIERYTDNNIEPVVDDFIAWLEYDQELKELYYANWKSKY